MSRTMIESLFYDALYGDDAFGVTLFNGGNSRSLSRSSYWLIMEAARRFRSVDSDAGNATHGKEARGARLSWLQASISHRTDDCSVFLSVPQCPWQVRPSASTPGAPKAVITLGKKSENDTSVMTDDRWSLVHVVLVNNLGATSSRGTTIRRSPTEQLQESGQPPRTDDNVCCHYGYHLPSLRATKEVHIRGLKNGDVLCTNATQLSSYRRGHKV